MEVTITNSPVHSESKISYPYGEIDLSYSCGFHTGVDIVPFGTTENNPNLYPVFNGQVVYISNNPNQALGCQVQILDNNGRYWRYCHLLQDSIQVSLNQIVNLNTIIGRMGNTGNVTGRHLHLECSTTQTWQCESFINPCEIIGIPNVDDLIIKYENIEPVSRTKKKFPWVLYARKLRAKF